MDKLSFRYRYQKIEYQFSVAGPYSPGHQLTLGEAQALNQLRAERIREAMRPAFKAAAAYSDGDLIPPETLRRVQATIQVYDENYQFQEIIESPERLGAIEKEARVLAVGRSPEGASEEEIKALAESIDLIAEARERVAARAEIARKMLEELTT